MDKGQFVGTELFVLGDIGAQLNEVWDLDGALLTLLGAEPEESYRFLKKNLINDERPK
jgi:hypothetical protein